MSAHQLHRLLGTSYEAAGATKGPTENEMSDLSPLWQDGCAEQSTRHNMWTKETLSNADMAEGFDAPRHDFDQENTTL
jgi:hypothetical protein